MGKELQVRRGRYGTGRKGREVKRKEGKGKGTGTEGLEKGEKWKVK